jgi:putative transposase
MVDHVHLLIGGTRPDSDLVRWITIGKQFSAAAYRRATRRRLWQEGWFDRVVRASDDRTAIIRYVIENPIRAGLVEDVRDYPYWGSCKHSREDLLASLR